MTDGQVLVLVFGLLAGTGLLVLVVAEALLDAVQTRRDPVIRDLRTRTHDNVPAAVQGHRDVSADPLKETT